MNEATDVCGDGGCVHMLLGPRQTTPCAVHDLVRPGPASGAPLRASKRSPAFLACRAAAGRGGKRLGRLEDVARQTCAALRVTQLTGTSVSQRTQGTVQSMVSALCGCKHGELLGAFRASEGAHLLRCGHTMCSRW